MRWLIVFSILQLSSPATFEYLDRFDHQRIRVDGGTWSEINLDDAPLPIEFQLANSSTSPKTFTGIGYASLTYVVKYLRSKCRVCSTRGQSQVLCKPSMRHAGTVLMCYPLRTIPNGYPVSCEVW